MCVFILTILCSVQSCEIYSHFGSVDFQDSFISQNWNSVPISPSWHHSIFYSYEFDYFRLFTSVESYSICDWLIFSSVTQSHPTLCDPINCSTPGLSVHHQLPESTQTHVHWVGDAIQPSHPLSSTSPSALNLSQHQGLFKWVSSSYQVAKVLEFQLQHQSFQWTLRTDLL